MRKLILFMHVSLDGFVDGPKGEMDWIKVDEEIFDYTGVLVDKADTALYGRVTYEMMENYWPTAADKPNASKHDIEHSRWYSKVKKVVVSGTMSEKVPANTQIVGKDLTVEIQKLKQMPGSYILMLGSPRASHSLMKLNLIDEFWLFLNPIILGEGMPFFKNISDITKLKLAETKEFSSGVIALHYEKLKSE